MRKGCCRMAAAFSLRKEYQMTGKNERKLKKWTALFLAAAMSLTACGSTASTGSSTSSRRALRQFLRAAHPQHPQQTFRKPDGEHIRLGKYS